MKNRPTAEQPAQRLLSAIGVRAGAKSPPRKRMRRRGAYKAYVEIRCHCKLRPNLIRICSFRIQRYAIFDIKYSFNEKILRMLPLYLADNHRCLAAFALHLYAICWKWVADCNQFRTARVQIITFWGILLWLGMGGGGVPRAGFFIGGSGELRVLKGQGGVSVFL